MKKYIAICLCLVLLLPACGQGTSSSAKDSTAERSSWQEQYDLGVRYLTEGKYEEAIIAFTAAIEIDPRRAPAYVGRGQAYVFSGDTEENLIIAQADFEMAIELDETNAEAWLGLADVYIRQGDYQKALDILREGLEKTGNNLNISEKISEMETGAYVDPLGGTYRRMNDYSPEGELLGYTDNIYDEMGRRIRMECYGCWTYEGTSTVEYEMRVEITYDSQNRLESYQFYDADGVWTGYEIFTYNNNLLTRQ